MLQAQLNLQSVWISLASGVNFVALEISPSDIPVSILGVVCELDLLPQFSQENSFLCKAASMVFQGILVYMNKDI